MHWSNRPMTIFHVWKDPGKLKLALDNIWKAAVASRSDSKGKQDAVTSAVCSVGRTFLIPANIKQSINQAAYSY